MTKNNLQNNAEGISKWKTPRLIDNNFENDEPTKSEEELKRAAFEESSELGYLAGIEKASQEMKSRFSVVDSYLNCLTQPFDDQNHELVEYIATLAGKIAKSLVRRELRTEPETIIALVRDTVSALNTSHQEIEVHLHPENARIIRELISTDSQEQNWIIVDDLLVGRTDCRVISNDSIVDADLQTRIDLIITQFLGDERSENRK